MLRTGSFAPPGSVYITFWNRFKANIERDSRGSIKVELNTSDPNEANLLSNVRRGRVECVGASLQGTSTILPEVGVLQLPHLFASLKEVDASYDKGLLDTYRKLFAAKGLAMLQFVEVGFTHTYATVPIKTPADVKGLKMRATQSRASQTWIKATGAEPVVLPISEAVPGRQTGLIKGGESGLVVYAAFIAKSASHYTLTGHAFDSGTIMCNKEWFNKLSADQKTAVQNGWNTRDQATASETVADEAVAAPAPMKAAQRLLAWQLRLEQGTTSLAFAVTVLVLGWDILGREVLGGGKIWATPIAVYANVFLSFVGMGIASAGGGHLRPRFFDRLAPRALGGTFDRLTDAGFALFCVGAPVLCLKVLQESVQLQETDPVLQWQVWPFHGFLVAAFLGATLHHSLYTLWPVLRPAAAGGENAPPTPEQVQAFVPPAVKPPAVNQ